MTLNQRFGYVFGAVYLAVGAIGLAAVGQGWNILAINHADNGLHFATAAVAIGVALADPAYRRAPARA